MGLTEADLFNYYDLVRNLESLHTKICSDPKNNKYYFIGVFKKDFPENEVISWVIALLSRINGFWIKLSADINEINQRIEVERQKFRPKGSKLVRKIPDHPPREPYEITGNKRKNEELAKKIDLLKNSKVLILKETFTDPELIKKRCLEISSKMGLKTEVIPKNLSEVLEELKI